MLRRRSRIRVACFLATLDAGRCLCRYGHGNIIVPGVTVACVLSGVRKTEKQTCSSCRAKKCMTQHRRGKNKHPQTIIRTAGLRLVKLKPSRLVPSRQQHRHTPRSEPPVLRVRLGHHVKPTDNAKKFRLKQRHYCCIIPVPNAIILNRASSRAYC